MELKIKDRKKPHTHHHHHHHDHDHGQDGTMTNREKLQTLCEHWIKHNDSHAGTYKDWADKAMNSGLDESSGLLKEIADMTDAISKKMEELAKSLEK